MRVHLEHESALGCMRVHLELAMFPDPPPRAIGLGTRQCLILAHRKSISENRCLILDHRKSISENRFQILDFRYSITENRFQKIDYRKSISENRFQILDYRKSSIGIRYPDIDLCYSNKRSLIIEFHQYFDALNFVAIGVP